MRMRMRTNLFSDGSATWDVLIYDGDEGVVEINLQTTSHDAAEWDFFRIHRLIEEVTGASVPVSRSTTQY